MSKPGQCGPLAHHVVFVPCEGKYLCTSFSRRTVLTDGNKGQLPHRPCSNFPYYKANPAGKGVSSLLCLDDSGPKWCWCPFYPGMSFAGWLYLFIARIHICLSFFRFHRSPLSKSPRTELVLDAGSADERKDKRSGIRANWALMLIGLWSARGSVWALIKIILLRRLIIDTRSASFSASQSAHPTCHQRRMPCLDREPKDIPVMFGSRKLFPRPRGFGGHDFDRFDSHGPYYGLKKGLIFPKMVIPLWGEMISQSRRAVQVEMKEYHTVQTLDLDWPLQLGTLDCWKQYRWWQMISDYRIIEHTWAQNSNRKSFVFVVRGFRETRNSQRR